MSLSHSPRSLPCPESWAAETFWARLPSVGITELLAGIPVSWYLESGERAQGPGGTSSSHAHTPPMLQGLLRRSVKYSMSSPQRLSISPTGRLVASPAHHDWIYIGKPAGSRSHHHLFRLHCSRSHHCRPSIIHAATYHPMCRTRRLGHHAGHGESRDPMRTMKRFC